MSTSTTEDGSIASSPTISETLDLEPSSNCSVEIETLLEKQLLIEKGRVDHLTNDNERLLAQNIGLCQAVKQQKTRMSTLNAQNDKLQQQVSKLFMTVRTLGKNNKSNAAKDAEIQQSLKDQFLILKNALIQKDDHIQNLSHSLQSSTKDLLRKNKEIAELHTSLNECKEKYESEKVEYEDTIKTHLESIKKFNSTMNDLQSAMDLKENEMNGLKAQNDELQKLLDEKADKIEDIHQTNHIKLIENEAKDKIIQELNKKIKPLQKQLESIKKLYEDSCQKMEDDKVRFDETLNELNWWKAEAVKLEKECDFTINELHELKSQVSGIEKNKFNQNNVDVWKKRFYLSLWRRFAEHEAHEYSLDQMRDVWSYLKTKYSNLKPAEKTETFKESFKISMYKSLKDIKNIDIDQLLLCQDPKELTDFLLSSDMSQQTQLRVAAQLLPVVEEYRINLQNDINKKVDKFIKKSASSKALKVMKKSTA